MKLYIHIIFLLLSTISFSQVTLTTSEITNKSDAGEGDLFKDSQTGFYYIGTTEGNLSRISPQELTFNSTTGELVISEGNSVNIAVNSYISICEFIRGEAVIEQTGRILFTVHPDLNGYKTSSMTVTINELSSNNSALPLIVKLEILRGSSVINVSEQVSFNSGTTFSATSNGLSNVSIQTGDILRLKIDQIPVNLADAPKGLTATIKLVK